MRRVIIAACVGVTFLLLFVYQFYVQSGQEYNYLPQRFFDSKSNKTVKVILAWTSYFGERNWLPTSLSKLGCNVSDCITTANRTLLSISSAVIFHWRDVNLNDLPFRNYGQMWLLFNKESPMHTPRHVLSALSENINLTVTYRLDSDIISPYGSIVSGNSSGNIYNKTSLVTWLVSNCNSASNREDYVNQLARYIMVDIYGNCGKKYCSNIPARNCYKKLGKTYKFYLSFENSICKDYITEKLYYALQYDMIPVVFGGGRYKDILPPNSFINALDFNSPKHLADYLLSVANNSSKYQSYFVWKESYKVVDSSFRWLCDVCRKLHENESRKTPKDLLNWWYNTAKCQSWKDGKLVSG